MELKVEVLESISKIIDKNIEFPYYGWWDHKKNHIIKMDIVYYDNKIPTIGGKISHINVIEINHGFGIHTSIKKDTVRVGNLDIVSNDINYYLRDYSDIATEIEYNNFKKQALKDLK